MKQTTLSVIILLLTMSQKMFIIISSFVFGYCIGYYSFELLKRRNPKDEINDFILSYNRKKGIQRRVFDKKLEQVKISNDCFFGDDFSDEEEFLVKTQKKIEQEIEGSEISYYFSKSSMSLCFENSKLDENCKRFAIKNRLVDG